MKFAQSIKNRLFPVTMAMLLALSLAACGGDGKADGNADATPAPALTEEEYMDAVTKMNEDMATIQTDAASLDTTDVDAAVQLLEDMKAPLQEFMSVTPPEKYQAAHEKLSSGCQSMIDFIDTTISVAKETDPAKQQEAATKMMEQLQTATTDMTEGAQMLQEASAG